MKCPKCAYLGFEEVERCRNCGYDFSLSSAASSGPSLPELSIRSDTTAPSPLDDLTLIDAATAPSTAVAMTDAGPDLERMICLPSPELEMFESEAELASGRGRELPLFGARSADDQPLITRASPPRQPLSVRRATPELPRARAEQARSQPFELSFDLDGSTTSVGPSYTPAARAHDEVWPEPRDERAPTAALSTRFAAVVIDLLILLTVDIVVIYFTLQICGISWQEAGLLPRSPLLAFLLVQNGGYLVAFTAGGQTLGKMATDIRVIGTESAGELDLGRALTRTVVWMMLAAPAGLGFLTLFGRDHRGLHDRFAGTRVVRASV